MRLSRLHLQNFRQHRNSILEFDSGLTGIIGPNGAGKTTILEAIAWALYGNPAARGTRDGIRWHRAPPRAQVRVELDFELSGHRYRVERGLTTAELFLDGSDAPIANTIRAVSEVLHRRLGMTRGEFFNTYFTGQKELNVMASMKPAERAQFLSRVLGYERLRGAQDLARDQRRVIAAEINGMRNAMRDAEVVARAVAEASDKLEQLSSTAADAERRHMEREQELAALVPRWETAQKERDQLQEVLSELKVAESEEANARKEAERIARELAQLVTARTELQSLARRLEPLERVAEEFQLLERLARDEGRRRTLLESIGALEAELLQLRARYAPVEDAPGREEAAAREHEELKSRLADVESQLEARRTEWVRDRQEAETKRQALRTQYAELRAQREKLTALGEDGACPTCLRPLLESYRTVLDVLDSQIETVVVDGNYYKSRVEQLEQLPAEVAALDEEKRTLAQATSDAQRRLTSVQHAIQERLQLQQEIAGKEERLTGIRLELERIPQGYDAARHEQLRGEVDALTQLDARATRLGTQIEREPALAEEQDRTAQALLDIGERVRKLTERRAATDFSEQKYMALRTAYEFAAAQLHHAEIAAVAAQSEVGAARAVLDAARREQDELARTEQQVRGLTMQRRLHEELDRSFSDLRTDLNFQLRPELSELASGFLRDLTDGRYGELELDDNYNVVMLEDGMPKPVISGGEEDIANLVLRLAISQMIAERSGQSFSLLILDEVFGSLDDERRRNVLELLRRVRDRFEQVIIISHIEQVRDGLDRVITVAYDDDSGSATVEGSRNDEASVYPDQVELAGAEAYAEATD